MKITHKLDEFLLELFPQYKESNQDLDVLMQEITKYFTVGPYKPKISIKDEWISIEVDTPSIIAQRPDYEKVVGLCEKGKYEEAKPILKKLIEINPTNSEYHRIMGQILSDESDQEEAINSLIDALKWDPTNGFALLMMGNIFARYKDDIDTALKYYNQALKINPQDHIAINNIGANLLQMGKTQEGIVYLEKAFAINPNYHYTSYGLSLAYEKSGNLLLAFNYAIKCLGASGNPQDDMVRSIYSSATKLAEELIKSGTGLKVFEEFKSHLEKKTGKQIRVEKDTFISTAAKIEFAENYDRDYHLIKYQPNYLAVEHLMMHELVHLKFATEAREEHCNMLFMSGREKRVRFIKDNEKDLKKLSKEGYDEAAIDKFIDLLYDGMNLQIFNAPVDLFIEDYLFENYPEFHPYQFISVQQVLNEGKKAVTDKLAVKITPVSILTASKVLNMVNATQLKDLFGIDILKQFNPLPFELKEAQRMWTEYLEYRTDRTPGEEYEVVQHWGDDLKLGGYFELVDEEDYRNRPKTMEEVLDSIVEDPYGLEVDKNFKEKQLKDFLASQESIGTNMAIMWFMVDALQFLKGMPNDKIKALAFEIATIGTQGINPSNGKSYKVSSIPGKDFSGYNLLAYYYVSWSLAMPDMVGQLGLNYEKEYEMARQMHNK